MFQWYAEASVCYAYLADVELFTQGHWTGDRNSRLAFERSRWWTRGWTLQELIAPQTVEFLASDWSHLGTKIGLGQLISDITGIRLEILRGASLRRCCAAEKMSWASTRQTTRPEDAAYCLLGLFGVNMPMLYGEGSTKSFIRLQKEILAQEPEYSLLAWYGPCTQWRVSVDPTPVLAVRPQQFHREMEMAFLGLKLGLKDTGGLERRIDTSSMRQPRAFLVRWKDLAYNPPPGHDPTRPRWLVVAMAAIQEPMSSSLSFEFAREPTEITNIGLRGRLFTLSIGPGNYQIDNHFDDAPSRVLAWTYILHPHGLVCIWLAQRHTLSDDIYSRDEAASLVIVPFDEFRTAFRLRSVYLRLPSPTEKHSRDLKVMKRDVVLVDDTVSGPTLLVAAQYPDAIRYWDVPRTSIDNPDELMEIELIGCYLVKCEPESGLFILMVGKHKYNNQVLLKTVPRDELTTLMSDRTAMEITALSFNRFNSQKDYLSTSVDAFSDQAFFAPACDQGVVMIRVPARPRTSTLQISMAYMEKIPTRRVKETTTHSLSKSLFEEDQPAVAELDHEVNIPLVLKKLE